MDGRIYFKDKNDKLQSVVISVKGGKNIKLDDIRALANTMDNTGSELGGFISFHKPTKEIIDIAIKKGKYKDIYNNEYNRIQFLTIEDMLIKKKLFDTP